MMGLSRRLSPIRDKQSAVLATNALTAKTAHLIKKLNARLSRAACEQVENGECWMLEQY